MDIKCSIFEEEKEEFSWDENVLKEFKNSIEDQEIPCVMDDIFLLGFLRARKFDIESSVQLLKNYYNMRVNNPQFFKNLSPSKLEHVLNMNVMQFLPKPDQFGSYIYVSKLCNWDTSVASATELLRVLMLYMDLQLTLHRTQEKKIVCIIDAGGLSLSHFYHFSPKVIYWLVMLIAKESYTIGYKAVHYVNLNIIMKAILSVLVPLLSDELKKKLHFHSDMKTLHEFISPDCLPLEYGGTLPGFDPSKSNNMIRSNEEFYRRNEEQVKLCEERKRSSKVDSFRDIIEDPEEERLKKFIEKLEEKFERHSNNPEAFLYSLKEDLEFEITLF
ncbi:alpha-tocopherol transfer protein-like [Centruroides vittatus]|uniref:alpha-tocopherol transfer protein-like n=1 Tax=Centruroides vittatus TaxID=120091 RepID=UPI0035104BD9